MPEDSPVPCGADWLNGVLLRGEGPDPGRPWRPAGRAGRAATDREVREGLVQRVVGDVVVAADVELDATGRAGALSLLVPTGLVVLEEAAAWVHVGRPLPAPRLVRAAGHRLPDLPAASGGVRVSFSRVRPSAAETTVVGGLQLTTPARTLLDVAAAHPHRAARLRAVMAAAGLVGEEDVRTASDRARGRARVRTARRALQLPRAPRPAPPGLSSSAAATP